MAVTPGQWLPSHVGPPPASIDCLQTHFKSWLTTENLFGFWFWLSSVVVCSLLWQSRELVAMEMCHCLIMGVFSSSAISAFSRYVRIYLAHFHIYCMWLLGKATSNICILDLVIRFIIIITLSVVITIIHFTTLKPETCLLSPVSLRTSYLSVFPCHFSLCV
jgi:hypothetical protein